MGMHYEMVFTCFLKDDTPESVLDVLRWHTGMLADEPASVGSDEYPSPLLTPNPAGSAHLAGGEFAHLIQQRRGARDAWGLFVRVLWPDDILEELVSILELLAPHVDEPGYGGYFRAETDAWPYHDLALYGSLCSLSFGSFQIGRLLECYRPDRRIRPGPPRFAHATSSLAFLIRLRRPPRIHAYGHRPGRCPRPGLSRPGAGIDQARHQHRVMHGVPYSPYRRGQSRHISATNPSTRAVPRRARILSAVSRFNVCAPDFGIFVSGSVHTCLHEMGRTRG